MTHEEAKKEGATHYMPNRKDSKHGLMYYRKNSNGTFSYMSFTGSWIGSVVNGDWAKTAELEKDLVKY